MRLLLAPCLLLLVVGFVAPMGTVLWISLHAGGHFSLSAYAEVLGSAVFFVILGRTIATALAVTALCVALGYPFAYFVATRARRHAGWIMALIAVPYLTSILIRSYAWVAILGGGGLVNRGLMALSLIEEPLPLVFNRFGGLVGMVHILLPMIVFPIYAAMQRIDPALRRAAGGLGATPGSGFVTVFLPLSWPGVAAGAALVFLSTLGFYITPALLGGPGDYMLAQAIEVRVSTLAEFNTAAAQAFLLLALVTLLLVVFRRRIVGVIAPSGSLEPPRHGRSGIAGLPCGLRRAVNRLIEAANPAVGPLLWGYGFLLLVFLLLPMVVVVLIAFSSAPYLSFPPPGYSWRWFDAYFADPRWIEATLFSLAVSAAAAATAVVAGSLYALALIRGRFRGRRLLWLCALAPMILPHITLGLGLFFTMVALHLNGTAISFWLGYTVIGLPYTVIIVGAALARFDTALERAAAGLGATPGQGFRTVTLPLLALSFGSAALFAFLAGFDDLIISLFLSSPRNTTIAMRLWEDIRLEISPKAAVVGVLQLAVLLAALAVVRLWGLAARRTAEA